jgi:hypothetical protein
VANIVARAASTADWDFIDINSCSGLTPVEGILRTLVPFSPA